MNKAMRKGLLLGAAGLVAGAGIGAGILYLLEPAAYTSDAGKVLLYALLSGIYGALAMGFSAVYDIERWSITRATVTHFAVTLGGMYGLGFALGWLSVKGWEFWLVTAMFIVCYFIIWLVQYMIFRQNVRKMNRELKEWKDGQEQN